MEYRDFMTFPRLYALDGSACMAVNPEVIPGGLRTYRVFNAAGKQMTPFSGEYDEMLCLVEPGGKIEQREEKGVITKITIYHIVEIRDSSICAVLYGQTVSM